MSEQETNAEISRQCGTVLIRSLREIYGLKFASGHADTATLREVINRLDPTSLSVLHRDHAKGQLYKETNSVLVIHGRRPR
jgi:hypothetical protein